MRDILPISILLIIFAMWGIWEALSHVQQDKLHKKPRIILEAAKPYGNN